MKVRLLIALLIIILATSCKKEDIPVEGLVLSSYSVNLKVGESLDIIADVLPMNATNARLTWISRDESVVTVSNSGSITGAGLGSAYIVINSSNDAVKDSCLVFVNGTLTGTAGNETVTMGSGYAYDVYYSMTNGVVATVPRNNWDIAFLTGSWTSTIIINSGAGVKLFTYPNGNISSWNAMNINDIATWDEMINSDTTWSYGAFERNSLGHPDYGWGIYNSITHDVVGDSLFVIQLADKSYKKLWIKKKASTANKYIFQFANIDGTGELTDTVDCAPYTAKNFIYYSFTTKDVVDREPASASWDLVITKYIEMISDDNGNKVPYPVTGVLTNTGVKSATLDNVPLTTTDYSNAVFVRSISEIGSDWKSFSMSTFQYTVLNNRVYFVKDRNSSVFRLVFTGFAGSSTGVITFSKAKLN